MSTSLPGSFFYIIVAAAAVVKGQTCPTLIWSDEFDGNALETNNWSHQLGDGCDIGLCGWGNNELQKYQAANTEVSNGLLTITTKKEVFDGTTKYTSSRINSIGKQSFRYGLFEARIKIPTSQGLWSAFWMLGNNIGEVGWPACGELDIMENIGREPKTVHGTMHYGPQWPNNVYSSEPFHLPTGDNFSDDFHVFGIEKFQDRIRILVDGVVFFTRTPENIAPEAWPFNEDFHFILNVAIGGLWPGNPDATTIFPSTMEVDYVRAYDNVFGNLEGPILVSPGENDVTYQVADGLLSYQYNWSVPPGATITSGQGTSAITVAFDDTLSGSGILSVVATSRQCGPGSNRLFRMPITAASRGFSFLSSQGGTSDQASFLSSTGSLVTDFVNPIRSTGGGDDDLQSPIVLRYERNGAERYDTLILSTAAVSDPSIYHPTDGNSYFKLDVYAAALLPGTTIILQLENSARSGLDYPSGRHSRYRATLDGSGQWQRLHFQFMDTPDPSETVVDRIVLLFEPDSFSNDVYLFDNLDSYSSAPSSGETSPHPTQYNGPSERPLTPTTSDPTVSPSSIPTEAPAAVSSMTPTMTPSSNSSLRPWTNSPAETTVPASGNESYFTIVSGDNTTPIQAEMILTSGLVYDPNAPNPLSGDITNPQPTVIGYERSTDLYDVIFYLTDVISDPTEYFSGDRYFTMNVYIPSMAVTPAGITVLLQLENSSHANRGNYPSGRHSRYEARVVSTLSSGWQQLRFEFMDFPDPTEMTVDTIVLLFNPGTTSSDFYYFDNLNSNLLIPEGTVYGVVSEEPTPNPSTSPPTNAPTTIAPSAIPSSAAPVEDGPSTAFDFSLVNVGDDGSKQEAQLVFCTGVWWSVPNPISSSSVNSSPSALQYRRNGQHEYDVIFYITNMINNPNDYVVGNRYLTIDVLYDGDTGNSGDDKEILVQFENTDKTYSGYPVGRHSRYRAIYDSSINAQWQRLRLEFVDRPDPTEVVVDKIVLLFEPGSFANTMVYYDNLNSYSP